MISFTFSLEAGAIAAFLLQFWSRKKLALHFEGDKDKLPMNN